MKYKIIFCLLFALTNSIKEPKLSKEKSFIMNNWDSNLEESECDAENKKECKDLQNPNKDEVCCYFERKVNDIIYEEYCRAYPNDISDRGKIIKSKEYKAFLREEKGYDMIVSENYPQKDEEKISCKYGEYSIVIENNYNEKEKNILKDESHCLNIYKKKKYYAFDVGECKDYLVLDSSKEAGIECGYLAYNITLKKNKTISYKTCYLFNLHLFSNMNKINNYRVPIFEIGAFEEFINSMYIQESDIEGYTVESYNLKGQKIKYDSKADKFIVEGTSFNLASSKYLLLLILILF